MKFTNDHLKHLSLLLLPALIWLLTNATVNTHTHILTGGIVISHAHPFDKNTGEKNPYPGHNHTKGELFLLDLISHPLTLLTFIFIGFFLTTKIQIVTFYYLSPYTVREHYYVMNYHAPPPVFL